MRRHYVVSTSLRRHVPAGNLPLPQYSKPCNAPPPNILNLPPPMIIGTEGATLSQTVKFLYVASNVCFHVGRPCFCPFIRSTNVRPHFVSARQLKYLYTDFIQILHMHLYQQCLS